jgi:predicted Fe-Mo cluster-binding NifX family protein
MKIIVTTTGPDLEAAVDPRFGRAPYFVAVDSETTTWQAHPNPAAEAFGGAGTLAAQFVAGQQAQAVISGAFGPNAFQALRAADIQMYLYTGVDSARKAIELYRTGELVQASLPTGPGRRG